MMGNSTSGSFPSHPSRIPDTELDTRIAWSWLLEGRSAPTTGSVSTVNSDSRDERLIVPATLESNLTT
jgi:hypothetical protein